MAALPPLQEGDFGVEGDEEDFVEETSCAVCGSLDYKGGLDEPRPKKKQWMLLVGVILCQSCFMLAQPARNGRIFKYVDEKGVQNVFIAKIPRIHQRPRAKRQRQVMLLYYYILFDIMF